MSVTHNILCVRVCVFVSTSLISQSSWVTSFVVPLESSPECDRHVVPYTLNTSIFCDPHFSFPNLMETVNITSCTLYLLYMIFTPTTYRCINKAVWK